MSDPTPTPPAAPTPPTDPVTPPAQDPTDWKAEARKWEQRAKENSDAATRLKEIEDAQKSDLERAQQEAADATEDAKKARVEALRYRIAAKHAISDEDAELFLTGSDEATLTKQAERLKERTPASTGPFVPGEGRTPVKTGGTTADQFADAISAALNPR